MSVIKTRQQALEEIGLLDSPSEIAFDRLTRLTCRLLEVPVSLISLIDEHRQFFMSSQGLPEPWASLRESPLSHSICQHVVAADEPLIIADTREDGRLCGNLAIPDMNVIAYLGIPLRTPDNIVIGSLCAIDTMPREWRDDEVDSLADLAAITMSEIAVRHHQRTGRLYAQKVQLQADLLDAVEQAVIASDLSGKIFYWNNFAETLYGWSAEEALGQNVNVLISAPALLAKGQEIMDRLVEGESWSGDFMVRGRDGTSFPAHVMDSPILDEEGKLTGVVGVSFDISERKASEVAIRENEQLLRKLIDNLFTFVGILTPDGTLMQANRTALNAANLQPKDVLNQPFEETYWWSYSEEVQEQLRDAINRCSKGQSSRYDVVVRLSDEQFITIDFMLAPIVNEKGEVTHLIPSGLNIEDRKRMEDELRQRADELSHLTKSLEMKVAERTAELERSNRELQEFAYVASHDLQEPLRKIIAFADRLRSRFGDELDATALDYMDRMQNAAERMKKLIDDLLMLSRVTTGGQPFIQIDLNKVIDGVLRDLEETIASVDGRVNVSNIPLIEADAGQMRRLLQNLISNSLKFHREGEPPVVTISAETTLDVADKKPQLRILVEDNGIGFDEKYLDRIFLPFQRLHGRTDYAGTGMGLAICRRIVERHRGKISAESSPSQGTLFIVTLPLQQTTQKENA